MLLEADDCWRCFTASPMEDTHDSSNPMNFRRKLLSRSMFSKIYNYNLQVSWVGWKAGCRPKFHPKLPTAEGEKLSTPNEAEGSVHEEERQGIKYVYATCSPTPATSSQIEKECKHSAEKETAQACSPNALEKQKSYPCHSGKHI